MKGKILCGVVCDDKTYNEFAQKRYHVPSHIHDGDLTLKQVEFFSKSNDYMKYYPEFAKDCQKIVEQAAKEIKTYYAAKDGRKGYKAMKHDNFQEYLRDLQKLHKDGSKERAGLKKSYDEAAERWNTAANDKTLSEYGKTSAKLEWLEAQKKYKDSISDLQNRMKADIQDIRTGFEEHIEDFYSANGDRMDDGVIRLFNSGIKLKDEEINRLVKQNVSNPTMLRLISDYCDKNKIDSQEARIYGTFARAAGHKENIMFNQVVEMLNKATSSNEKEAEIWGEEKGHFSELSEKLIQEMSELAVKPEASTQSEQA